MALPHTDRRTESAAGLDIRHPAVPSQWSVSRSAPGTPSAARGATRSASPRRGTVVAVVGTVLLALGAGAGSIAVTVQENARRAEVVRHNTALATAAHAADVAVLRQARVSRALDVRADLAAEMAARTAAVGQAIPQVEAARAALAAAPQATPETRNALAAAIDTAGALTVADPLPFVATMADAVAALAAPQAAVAASQAAWRAAEDARIAAEAQAAAARAAAAQRAAAPESAPGARAPRAASGSPRAVAPAAPAAAPTRSRAAAAPAPSAPAPAAPAPATGAGEFSAGAVGEAINAYRVSRGLPALGISRSGGLFAHAAAMAQRGEIWHSGADKIVGYTKPASAATLVQRWAASPPHNAWMLRTDVSSMQVGAATLDGRLYAAVDFG